MQKFISVLSAGVIVGFLFSPLVTYIFVGWDLPIEANISKYIGKPKSLEDSLDVKQNITELESKIATLEYLKQENTQLKALLGLKEKGFGVREGRIMGQEPTIMSGSTLVYMDTTEGIHIGQAVVSQGALVGVVTQVSQKTVTVRFIHDGATNIAVTIGEKETQKGLLQSRYGVDLMVSLIPRTEEVIIGDYVYTSGIDGLPSGIVVGKVRFVENSDLFKNIFVDRLIDTRTLTKVFIVLP